MQQNVQNNLVHRTAGEINRPADEKSHGKVSLNKEALALFSPIVPVRRASCLPDEINHGNYAKAAGIVGLMAINLPEDTRDLKAAAKQLFKNELPKYDYKNFQMPFSFIRGTFLEPVVNKMGQLGVKIHQYDEPLYNTRLGQYLSEKLNFYIDDMISSRISPQVITSPLNPSKTIIEDVEIYASKIEGKPFGKLLGNALLRMPVISVGVAAALELPAIYKAFAKPEKKQDKAIEGTAQIAKSAVSTAAIMTGVGMFGALLKGKGPVGSLVGMGLGSIAGAYVSNKAGNKIDFASCKIKSFIS